MKENKDVLASIVKTAQMGQTGIRSVLNMPLRAGLSDALRTELREYDTIEQEALALATARGWKLQELNPAIRHMTNMMTKSRLSFGNASSKAAAMMIQGNTRGMIKGYANLNHCALSDERIACLSRKLLACEEKSIQRMQEFL